MTTLTDNLKKSFTDKIFNLVLVFALLIGVFGLTPIILNMNKVMGYAFFAGCIIIYLVIRRYFSKWLDKWKINRMQIEEKLKFNKIDTAYGVLIGLFFIGVFILFTGSVSYLFIIFVAFIIGVRESDKWREYKEEKGKLNHKQVVIEEDGNR